MNSPPDADGPAVPEGPAEDWRNEPLEVTATEEEGIARLLSAPNWKKAVIRYRKRFKKGWALYRQSKSGLIGLGIIMGFFFLAIFAPFLTPYDLDFTAPGIDVFIADLYELPIERNVTLGLDDPMNLTWFEPIGYADKDRLREIIIYSSGGFAVKYGLDLQPQGSGIGIDVVYNVTRVIPSNITKMFPVPFYGSTVYFAIANTTLYELSFDTMAARYTRDVGFRPVFFSNLWANPSGEGNVFYVMANETRLTLHAKIPPNVALGEYNPKTYFDTMDILDHNETRFARIIGDPMLFDVKYDLGGKPANNGSLVVLPTDHGITAIELGFNRTGSRIVGMFLGDVVWHVPYSDIADHFGRVVKPIHGRPISISKELASEALGKDRITLASSDGFLYAIMRSNGSLNWSTTLVTSDIREPVPTGVYPTYVGDLVVTGTSEGRGFIVSVDRDTGNIKGNRTYYQTFPSPVVGRPYYIPSSNSYIFTTETEQIYILDQRMELDATFSVLSGAATGAAFVGNIIVNAGSVQGNYYALVTDAGTFFTQSVSGTYIAPLKPGTYPSGNTYFLGTDVFGSDLWTQLIYATRTELVVGLVAAILSAVVGTLVGLISGYYGGWIDTVLMRLTDIFLTLPILVIALLLAAVLGPSIGNIILIIAIFSWAGVARVIRAQTLSLKNRAFIDAARVSGASNRSIIMRHLGPNVLPLTFLYMVFTISGAIITEAILAFLGMGDPTSVTWGMMLQYLRISGNTLTAPWWLLPPGIAITLLSLAFYMIGRAFDEVVNPRLRAR